LLLTARPPNDPIPKDLIHNSLSNLSTTAYEITHVESGSYVELITALKKHQESNCFHVLHLDMHGTVLTPKQLRQTYADLVAYELDNRCHGLESIPRSDHPDFEKPTTYLWFNHNDVTIPISAAEIAPQLGAYGVPLIVLNACQSGEVPHGDAPLTSNLVEWGAFPCVGFQHPLTAACAMIFFGKFYTELASSPGNRNFVKAVREARQALIDTQTRGSLDIHDWWLPVLYAVPGSQSI
jgi:hypothetical protein